MAAPKVWVPNELLKSADLNGAFATVAQGYMPGCRTTTGPATAMSAGTTTELPGATPIAGNDTGYWNDTTKRAVVPAGMQGWHSITAYVTIAPGGTQGDVMTLILQAHGYRATFPRVAAATSGMALSIVVYAGAGVEFYVQALAPAVASTGTLVGFQVARLASFGAYA